MERQWLSKNDFQILNPKSSQVVQEEPNSGAKVAERD